MRYLTLLILFIGLEINAQDRATLKLIDSLCSPYMAGRGYEDNGHRRAAQYISEEFQSLGLLPIGQSYFQEFKINVNTFPGDIKLKLDQRELELGKDFIPQAHSGPSKGKKRIVHLDTLIFSDSLRAASFLEMKLRNKVLVYDNESLKKLRAMPFDYVEKAFTSTMTIELTSKLTASFSTRQYEGASLILLDSLFSNQNKKAKFSVEAQYEENLVTQNVIGYIPAKGESKGYLLVTAHYDHIGKMGNIYFPGANDNSSGIAMLMDIAKYYKDVSNRLEYDIVFIAFGAEEVGLLGSEYFVKNAPFSLKDIRFVMNLDLMGNGEKGITVVNGTVFKNEMNILDSLNTEGQFLPEIKKRGKAANSDHYHFSERGVPAFFIYTMGGEPWYHDIYDKPNALTLDKFDQITALLESFFKQL